MNGSRRSIFLLNGKQDHWGIGKEAAIWGLPSRGHKWTEARACLQELGFIAGSEVLAITGPYANFRAVIGSDRGVYYDDISAPFGFGPGNEIYPVRIELTNIKDINRDWFEGPRGYYWRERLQDVYFSKSSLYVLPLKNVDHRHINQAVVFGAGGLATDSNRPKPTLDPISFEDRTAQTFSQLGFRVEQLGHKRPLKRVPDGVAMLPRSLVMYIKSLNANPYFVVWDCKFDCGLNGLRAEDERAIKEYIEAYAPSRKAEAEAGDFWFLVVARDKGVAERIHYGASQWTWLAECYRLGLRGFRVVSLSSVERLVKTAVDHRRSGGDSDAFLGSILPREFAKPYLG